MVSCARFHGPDRIRRTTMTPRPTTAVGTTTQRTKSSPQDWPGGMVFMTFRSATHLSRSKGMSHMSSMPARARTRTVHPQRDTVARKSNARADTERRRHTAGGGGVKNHPRGHSMAAAQERGPPRGKASGNAHAVVPCTWPMPTTATSVRGVNVAVPECACNPQPATHTLPTCRHSKGPAAQRGKHRPWHKAHATRAAATSSCQ